MSEPAKEWQVILTFMMLLIAMGSYMVVTVWSVEKLHKDTRRCIVESRNSVEVPEVCK